ncbi:MAG: hypothetical protein WBD73_01275 [Candidatus Acidiferrales bacterium]
MRISIKGLALAAGLVWGGGILCLGIFHLAIPSYGAAFLDAISSIYPGFHGARSIADAFIGGIYAFVDGAGGGLIFASLYNLVAGQHAHESAGRAH